MGEPVMLMILNLALAGFTGILAWFLKELWQLWKEERQARETLTQENNKLGRDVLEMGALLREMIGEIRLELAKDYVATPEFRDFRDAYARPQIHNLRERVSAMEGRGLFKPT